MAGAMDGKVCLITGATSGVGKAAALALAQRGARIIAVGRNSAKGAAIVEEIERNGASDAVEFLQADLSSQQAIRDLAGAVTARYDRLDVLVNDAGAIFSKRRTSVDGLEMTFALNHLGYFLLTALLLPLLKESAPSRIVVVASDAQGMGKINFDDLQSTQRYSGLRAYSQSKLANVLFTYELARRLHGSGVTANCLHPGFVASGFGHNNGGPVKFITAVGQRLIGLSPERGAETVVYLASSPLVEGVTGKYFVKKAPKKSSRISYDEATARRLWDVSERLTGLVG